MVEGERAMGEWRLKGGKERKSVRGTRKGSCGASWFNSMLSLSHSFLFWSVNWCTIGCAGNSPHTMATTSFNCHLLFPLTVYSVDESKLNLPGLGAITGTKRKEKAKAAQTESTHKQTGSGCVAHFRSSSWESKSTNWDSKPTKRLVALTGINEQHFEKKVFLFFVHQK